MKSSLDKPLRQCPVYCSSRCGRALLVANSCGGPCSLVIGTVATCSNSVPFLAAALPRRRRKNQKAAMTPKTTGIPTPSPTPRPTSRLSPLSLFPDDPDGAGVGELDSVIAGALDGEIVSAVTARTDPSVNVSESLQLQELKPEQQNVPFPQIRTPFPPTK
jgi:hypothetical protein